MSNCIYFTFCWYFHKNGHTYSVYYTQTSMTTTTREKKVEYKWYSREKRQSKCYWVYLRRYIIYIIQLTDWKSHKYWHKDGSKKREANDGRWWWRRQRQRQRQRHRWRRRKRDEKKVKKKKKNEFNWMALWETNGIWLGYTFVLCGFFLWFVCLFVCERTLLSCYSSCQSIYRIARYSLNSIQRCSCIDFFLVLFFFSIASDIFFPRIVLRQESKTKLL